MDQLYIYYYITAFARDWMGIPKWEILTLRLCFHLAKEWDSSILDEMPLDYKMYEKLVGLQRGLAYENISAGTGNDSVDIVLGNNRVALDGLQEWAQETVRWAGSLTQCVHRSYNSVLSTMWPPRN